MSGGSFHYLYCHVNGLDAQRADVERMRDRLAELGFGAAATDTARVLALLDEAERQAQMLSDVWHAAEWFCSGDYGRDQVDEVVAEYNEKRPADAADPGAVAPPELLGWRWVAPGGQVYVLAPEGGTT